MKNLRNILFLMPFLVFAFSCEDDVEDVINDDDNNDDDNSVNIVEITVDNDGATAYFVSEINGNEDVTALNENSSEWELKVGTRYELTVTGASAHPFALRDSDNNILLSMNSEVGSFESVDAVNFESSATSFDFTLTQALADELNNYVCTVHIGMTGSVTTS
jgi:plastocyanin